MATADKLKKYVTAIADAIRAKEGSTELINPQDFAERIEALQSGSGGGTDLEGEYFLAKSNGRYWKFTFMHEGHRLRIEDFETSQIDAMYQLYKLFPQLQNVYGAAVSTDDASLSDELVRLDGFYNIGSEIEKTYLAIQRYKNGYDYDKQDFNKGFLRVWKECDIKSNPPVEIPDMGGLSLNSCNLVELIKIIYAMMEGDELTDDETISLIEQMFMLIPATEEEYKYWRFED